ncbi:MAG: DNA mismatch repair protein MutS [Lachnospiraceae bacterium]|nr:DNA mismatch repair protein MutS [Lachnospiraceae bacterium]
MNKHHVILGYDQILEKLAELAGSAQAKELIWEMKPFLQEVELRRHLRETTQARQLLDLLGTPPVPAMDGVEELAGKATRGELLEPEQLEQIGFFLTAVRRMREYLARGKQYEIGIAFYDENLVCLDLLEEEIARSIRQGRVDDYASGALRTIRRDLIVLEEKMKARAEGLAKTQKAYLAESFIVSRNGRICLPVKKEYRSKLRGAVVDQSSTGATVFIEPEVIAGMREEYELLKIAEDSEERRILYEITGHIADEEAVFAENIRMLVKLDFMFARGRLSADMGGVEPQINTRMRIAIRKGRHPMLNREQCVPLDFSLEGEQRGIVITGPNTGGKTVAIKTVGLFGLMACSGLHVPCEAADISMNSQVLCDIGDGQNIADNLSTFSAHISNVVEILKRVDEESLVILDELGSGTDPAEGMGIAIAILEELRLSRCRFLVTTHYPEVKVYAEQHAEILNARMAFDRDNLRPLYRLEIGKSGESCALYIAKRLGLPDAMIAMAAREAYGDKADQIPDLSGKSSGSELEKIRVAGIRRQQKVKPAGERAEALFQRGDSVEVYPEKKIGIVVNPADQQGNVLVQIQKEKGLVNQKRLKLKVAASQLYPEDYDFSIIFDTAEYRKARHDMGRKYQEGKIISNS